MPHEPKRIRMRKPRGTSVKSLAEGQYGRRWARMAKAYLREHPVCYCGWWRYWDGQRIQQNRDSTAGTVAPAVLVDHIRPINAGGEMWEPENWQALCLECHAAKTRRWG